MPETNTYSPAKRLGVKDLVKAAQQPVVECASNGFELPEDKARIIDALAKDLPKDFTYRRLSATPSEFDLPEGERTDVSFITTDAKDRDGDVVLPQGGDWKDYDGVVPFNHLYKDLPVGINWWVRPAMKGINAGLRGKTHYPTKPVDWGTAPWLPSAVLHMMQQPIPGCTGKSIGFLPLNIRQATAEEKAKRPDWKDAPIIDRWAALEYSVASVPANATAQMEMVAKMLKGIEPTTELAEGLQELARKIRTDGPDNDGDNDDVTASMPSCPKCMTPDHVQRKDEADGDGGGMYLCMKCMTTFSAKDEDDDEYGKSKALTLNHACVSRAKGLISSGKINHGAWSAPVGSERKADDCLAVDSGASDAAKYRYPIIKGGEVYARAVGNAAARAEANHLSAVASAAHALSEAIKAKKSIDDALAAPFLTVDSYRKLKTAEQQNLAEWARSETVRTIRLAIAAAAGQV